MLSSAGLPLIGLVLVIAAALGAALLAILQERQRRDVLRRATGAASSGLLVSQESSLSVRLLEQMAEKLPIGDEVSDSLAVRLLHAGFDRPNAARTFTLIRVGLTVTVPLLVLLTVGQDDLLVFALLMGLALFVGYLGPVAVLDRLVANRQEMVRRAVPDALDLLVVCVEAGIALDAALQRVAREMRTVHPVLALELISMTRRMSAGAPRDQALQALFKRTGVEELRSLTSHLVQSERLGTSVANVLRVYGEQLRRQRRVRAEKRAATASTRMLIPLALFIFPTMFVVLLGPAAMSIIKAFDSF